MVDEEYLKSLIILTGLTAKDLMSINGEGKSFKDDVVDIDINNIKRIKLIDYLREQGKLSDSINLEKIDDRAVIILPFLDGRRREIEVQELISDIIPEMSMDYDKDGNIINKESQILEKILSKEFKSIQPEILYSKLKMNNFEDLAQLISSGSLEPKEIAKMLGIEGLQNGIKDKSGENRDNAEKSEEKELNKSDTIIQEKPDEVKEDNGADNSEEKEDDSKEKEPSQLGLKLDTKKVNQTAARILSQDKQASEIIKNGGRLKQVLRVNQGKSIRNIVQDPGAFSNSNISDAPADMYRFSGGENLNDRVIIIQNGKVKELSGYDRELSINMSTYGRPEVDKLEDKDTKFVYTDEDGNKIVEDLVRKPDDLSFNEKEAILKKLAEIDRICNSIRNDSSLLEEEMYKQLSIQNDQRLKIICENGLVLPEIQSEIRADNSAMLNKSDEIENEDDQQQSKNNPNDEEEQEEDFYDHFPKRDGPFDSNRYHY